MNRRLSAAGVLGELLVTAGVLVGLFVGWQVLFESARIGAGQNRAAATESDRLEELIERNQASTDPGDPPAIAEPDTEAESIGVMYVPRFGADWKRVIRQGVDPIAVLNSTTAGIGHYPGTQMPGEIGNFAIAAHDTGWGNTFIALPELRVGDEIYIQTAQGWFTYVFRNLQYVEPTQVDVLNPVPQSLAVPADRLLTMTTCNPRYRGVERIAAYSTFAGFSTEAPDAR
jgi:sortase A